eukprot:s650_g11.t1
MAGVKGGLTMGLLGKLNFWKKPKVSAVQPVILEEVSPEGARQELRPHCVQQETIREVEEEGGSVVPEAPTSSRSIPAKTAAVPCILQDLTTHALLAARSAEAGKSGITFWVIDSLARAMSRVLDYAVWKEHVGRVQRQELARVDLPHAPIDKELPFNRSFARGWPHGLYNDSSKTRMLLTPTGPGRGCGGYGREAGLTPRLGDFKESHERSWRVEKMEELLGVGRAGERESRGNGELLSTDWAPHSHRSRHDAERHDQFRLPALGEEVSTRISLDQPSADDSSAGVLLPTALSLVPDRSVATRLEPGAHQQRDSEQSSMSRSCQANREPVRQSQAQPKISFDDTDTRTPSPSECGDPDSLNFDAKPEHTYLGITKEFGHMIGSSLQSNKWDRRCQVLNAFEPFAEPIQDTFEEPLTAF